MDYNEYKEKVKSANDIVDIIGEYVDLKRAGNSYKGLCPFHGEKTPSFFVMPENQFFYCHGCHIGGDVINFLCKYNNIEFKEALSFLADRAGIEKPTEFEKNGDYVKEKSLKKELLSIYKSVASFYYEKLKSDEGKKALSYLNKRGISKNMINAFGLGYSPKGGTVLYEHLKQEGYDDEILKETGLFSYKNGKPRDLFVDRLMFPIMDRASKVIAFGGRILGDGEPKYINSPETKIYSKKENLYGIHRATKTKNNRIILVEGYMDVISLHMAGFVEAVASLGTSLTKEQVFIISKIAKYIYLIYDTDKAGTNAALRAIPMLKEENLFVNVVSMKPFKDPDELIQNEGTEGLLNRIKISENAIFFEMDCKALEYDRKDPTQNAEFVDILVEKLAKKENPIERKDFTLAFAKRYDLDEKILFGMVNKKGEENRRKEGIFSLNANVSKIQKDPTKEDDNRKIKAEINIIKALLNERAYLKAIKEYEFSIEYFTNEHLKEVAKIAFDENITESILISNILGRYEDERQSIIAGLLNESNDVDSFSLLSAKEKEKYFWQSLKSLLEPIYRQKLIKDPNKYLKKLKDLENIDKNFMEK